MSLDERVEALEKAVADLQRRATTDAEIPPVAPDLEGLVEAHVARARRDDAWFRKEARILAFGLACLLFLGWVLQRVHVGAPEVAALVGALLASLALFWRQLSRKHPP